jgi:glycosyltransferase involved in cell wall biosynthesis
MRICLVYDCLYPHTVGGAERVYRQLALRLRDAGHEVTYLTMRQWEGELDDLDGIDVRAVAPRMKLYDGERRRIGPPVIFGAGVLWHLLRHGHRYDVVQTISFPYFSVLATALARPIGRYRVGCDWFEVWSRGYWRSYLGRIGGWLGWTVQKRCARVRQHAFCFSRLYAQRLRELGLRGELTLLEGAYEGPTEAPEPLPAEPLVVFAGRQIPEKRAPAVAPAVALAADRVPGLRGVIYGDGPDHAAVLASLEGTPVQAPGFVDGEEVHESVRRALCVLAPSSREGYGLIVVEASAAGTPAIVVRGPDNAAVELVEDGVNGFVAESAAPEDLAAAIVRVHEGGEALRRSTREWFAANARRLSLESSLETVLALYAEA